MGVSYLRVGLFRSIVDSTMVSLSDQPDQESGQAFSRQPEISRASATRNFPDRHVNPLNSERDLRGTGRHLVAFALDTAMVSKSAG